MNVAVAIFVSTSKYETAEDVQCGPLIPQIDSVSHIWIAVNKYFILHIHSKQIQLPFKPLQTAVLRASNR